MMKTVVILSLGSEATLLYVFKVGSIIRMYSLHAKLHSPNDQPDVSFIQFHLHGGTVYGRGVTVLPESHADAKELKA